MTRPSLLTPTLSRRQWLALASSTLTGSTLGGLSACGGGGGGGSASLPGTGGTGVYALDCGFWQRHHQRHQV
jgi:hypothetical protein